MVQNFMIYIREIDKIMAINSLQRFATKKKKKKQLETVETNYGLFLKLKIRG